MSRRHTSPRFAPALILVACIASPAGAATVHVTPAGAGDRSGSTWANAKAAGDAQAALDALKPGDALNFGSGTYDSVALKVGVSGVKVAGVDTGAGPPVFRSNFDKTNPAKTGATLIRLALRTADLTIENLVVERYRQAVVFTGGHAKVRVVNVDVSETRDAFWVDGGATKENPGVTSRDLSFADCDVKHFTKQAFRVRHGNAGVTFTNCHADAGGKDWATEPFQMGFHVLGGGDDLPGVVDRDITYTDCTARNSYNDAGKKYWNGDGFCTERAVENVTYVRCGAFDNTDGGWDLKNKRPTLIDCVALGNKRNFRFWTPTNDVAVMRNCLSAFSIDRSRENRPGLGVWALGGGGTLELERCTLWQDRVGLAVEDGSVDKPTRVKLDRCVFGAIDGGVPTGSEAVTVEPSGSVVASEAPVKLKNPTATWRGGDDSFDPIEPVGIGYQFSKGK